MKRLWEGLLDGLEAIGKWFGSVIVAPLLFGGTVAVTLGGIYAYERLSCQQVETMTHFDTEYRFPSGCYVRFGGQWIPQERWQEVNPSLMIGE